MKIVHPTDFSSGAEQAREEAIQLAQRLGAELILLHVSVETPAYGEELIGMGAVQRIYDAQRKWAQKTLDEQVAAGRDHGVAVRGRISVGSPHAEIVKAAQEEGADLIVMGTHGRSGLDRLLLGSVADRVIRAAPCPVLTVREAKRGGGLG